MRKREIKATYVKTFFVGGSLYWHSSSRPSLRLPHQGGQQGGEGGDQGGGEDVQGGEEDNQGGGKEDTVILVDFEEIKRIQWMELFFSNWPLKKTDRTSLTMYSL